MALTPTQLTSLDSWHSLFEQRVNKARQEAATISSLNVFAHPVCPALRLSHLSGHFKTSSCVKQV